MFPRSPQPGKRRPGFAASRAPTRTQPRRLCVRPLSQWEASVRFVHVLHRDNWTYFPQTLPPSGRIMNGRRVRGRAQSRATRRNAMPNVDRHRPAGPHDGGRSQHIARRHRVRRGTVALVASAFLALCAGQALGSLGAPPAGSSTPAGGALGVGVASYAGDSVGTTTQAAQAGSDVTYQVTVANSAAQGQTNVSVLVTLPTTFTFDATTVTTSAGTASDAAGVLTWSIPSLGSGSSDSLTYTETTDAPLTF